MKKVTKKGPFLAIFGYFGAILPCPACRDRIPSGLYLVAWELGAFS